MVGDFAGQVTDKQCFKTMMAKKEGSLFDWLKLITGWQKAAFTAIVVMIVGGASTFAYNNFSPPTSEKRMDRIELSVGALVNKGNEKDIQDALMKNNLSNLIISFESFKKEYVESTKELLKEIRKIN